jgi:hypothetical protein
MWIGDLAKDALASLKFQQIQRPILDSTPEVTNVPAVVTKVLGNGVLLNIDSHHILGGTDVFAPRTSFHFRNGKPESTRFIFIHLIFRHFNWRVFWVALGCFVNI